MRIEQKVVVTASPGKVWGFLTDPYQVVQCLPGAALTSQIDDRTYEGAVTVKVGPVTATYKGSVRFERLDAERLEAELVGRGQDVRGKGGAEVRMLSRLVPRDGGSTEIAVTSDVNISGILAQLGRGMIEMVSAQIFQQFTAAMRQKLEAPPGSGPGDAPPGPPNARPLDALALGAKAVEQTVRRAVRRLRDGGGGGA